MRCPKCGRHKTKVVDSRLVYGSYVRWRRRRCQYISCGFMFTTYEGMSIIKNAPIRNMEESLKLMQKHLEELKKSHTIIAPR